MIYEEELLNLLFEIDTLKSEKFSGLGLLVYGGPPELLPVSPLKKDILELPISNKDEIIDFLIKASDSSNLYHDGFHLLNKRLELTHVSQFVSPEIIKGISLSFEHGSRYRTALYSSFLRNIFAAGVLSKSYEATVFVQGNKFKK